MTAPGGGPRRHRRTWLNPRWYERWWSAVVTFDPHATPEQTQRRLIAAVLATGTGTVVRMGVTVVLVSAVRHGLA